MRFPDMMTLDERGPDSYVGRGPRYPWGGLYGGQIVAQSVLAAAATVEAGYRIHSLHAYFIRKGDADQPIRFDVERLRDGRSYVNRAVVARQADGAICNVALSFQRGQAEAYHQPAPFPEVPAPGEMENTAWSPMLDRRFVADADGRATAWLRVPDATDDPVMAAAALTYLSDDLATDAVRSERIRFEGDPTLLYAGISLDHAIWFHQPAPADGWQLHDFRCESLGTPRGLATGRIFSLDGAHLATVTQEVLLRPKAEEEVSAELRQLLAQRSNGG